MPQTKRHTLKNVFLDEVSLVDNPANPKAVAVLYKRADGVLDGQTQGSSKGLKSLVKSNTGDLDMDIKELEASLQKAEDTNKTLVKAFDAFKAEVVKHGFEIEGSGDNLTLKKSAPEEMIDFNGTKIAKSAVPEPILKQLETQAKELAEIKKRNEADDLRKRAEEAFPNLAGTAAQKAALMKSLDSIEDEGDREELMKSLKAADNAVSKMFEETGVVQKDESSPSARLEKMATDYMTQNGVDYHTAFAQVTKSGDGAKLMVEARNEAH